VNNLMLTSHSSYEDAKAQAHARRHHDLKSPELSQLRYIITLQGLRHLAGQVKKAQSPNFTPISCTETF
jgi:hypothetical protein